MAAFIEVNLRGFDRATRKMLRAGSNVRPAFTKSRRSTRNDQRDHMRSQVAPRNRRWKSLAPSTRERRLRLGGRTNKFTKKGRLKKRAQKQLNRVLGRKMVGSRNLKMKIGRRFIKLIGKVGGSHQTGARVGKRSKLPKREWLYFSRALQTEVRSRIVSHLVENFNK